ncbi:ABC transporter ATP-binding protein [Streptomyces sp. NPDC085932]|uniref:ABC transporter ATP-binding protein n=1 Tax=Streptomyces sp. NPDC085932 TaxID=3365741 RepID=UPI0037D8EBEA
MTAPILQVQGLSKRFGHVVVAENVTFEVQQGEALGIVGPNGAGKSTLLNLIAGTVRPDSGNVRLSGRSVTRESAATRCRAGIGRSYQIPRPFSDMSVFENVLVATTFGAGTRGANARNAALRCLERTGLDSRADEPAGTLRLLDRKRLELARALATRPDIVLLDEIAGGLAQPELPQLVQTIRQVQAEGVAVVWIEHVVQALMAVADRLMCLAQGRVLAIGEPKAVMDSAEVRTVYLGTDPGVEMA